ncbi:MAG: sulfite exporter TauE/SafE family protein [Alphaproteobacteria bacterium]|nr:sulfite exporter TauE/SafE family protein [Alphaproteobacteria bacterium]
MDIFISLVPKNIWATDIVYACITLFISGLIRGFSGFGSAMVNAPILSLLWGPTVGIPVAALIELVPAIQLTPKAIPNANWRLVWLMGIPALILIPLGSWLLTTLPADFIRRFVALIVLMLVITLWSGWRYKGKRTTSSTILVGSCSGLLSGATGMGGPPVILYLMAGKESAKELRAILVCYFTIILVGLMISFGFLGLFSQSVIWQTIFLVLPFLIGIFIGALLFPLAAEKTYRNISLLFLVISSLYVLVN